MKKIFSLLAFVGIIMLASCGSNNTARHPIADHMYAHKGEQIYFGVNGTAEVTQQKEDGLWYNYPYFTYEIKGKTINVYHDNSSAWTDGSQGELACTYTYKSKDDTLIDESGGVWHKVR